MRYGDLEFAYAEPIAEAIAHLPSFRTWMLSRTIFSASAETSRVLVEEMRAKRGKSAQTWWRSHYTERCRCNGCSGQETDILTVFEDAAGERFAIHFEVKQPTDRFPSGKDQAANYRQRAACWTTKPPPAVVPHHHAATGLLYSARREQDYLPNLSKFDFAVTFEEIRQSFPMIALPDD